MTDEVIETSPTRTPLSYATAPYAGGYGIEQRANGDVVVDLRPVSTSLFVTILVPWALSLVFAALLLLALFGTTTSVTGAWVMAPLALISAAYWLYVLARHRHVRRIIRVDGGILSYSNAATGARFVNVLREDCRRIRVRRCWWRPWTVQVQAEADVSFWSTRTNVEPVILLIDTSRARLEEVAAILRRALQAR